MISFRQFLDEAIKSKRAALRDLVKGGGGVLNPHDDNYRDQINTSAFIPNTYHDGKPLNNNTWRMYTSEPDEHARKMIGQHLQNIPMDKILTTQARVSKRVVAKKITGAFKREGEKESPRFPIFVKHPDGSYILRDGNHRVTARKIRGFTHIRGIVQKDD